VSVYNARELDAVLDVFEPEIVQAPLNALDQRLAASGHLARLKRQGVEVHSRSVFLQGLLLMEPKALPAHFAAHRSRLAGYRDAVSATGMTPTQAALSAVLACPEVDCVIVGVCSRAQLEEVVAAAGQARPADELLRFACEDEDLIDPSRWPSPSAGA
jgi:aryl-alcohol dehydrogenase-like predicted oxidoreductase